MNPPFQHVNLSDAEAERELAQSASTARRKAQFLALAGGLPVAGADWVITDIGLPDLAALGLMLKLKARSARVPVIMITGHGDISLAVQAMRAGVIELIEKSFGESRALEALAASPAPVSGQTSDEAVVRQRLDTLSERERQVLNGVIDGHPNKVIARDLGISPRTVEIYRAKLMSKMQADSLAALVRMTVSMRGDRRQPAQS